MYNRQTNVFKQVLREVFGTKAKHYLTNHKYMPDLQL